MLKSLRILIATVVLVAMTALFLDFTDTVPNGLHWLAHAQLVPSALMGGIGLAVFAAWLLLTLLFGRVYCSAACPLGILQDVFARLAAPLRGKRHRYRFREPMTKTRSALLLAFLASLPFFPVIVSLLEPYSNFGRIAASLLRPLGIAVNNLLAGLWSAGPFRFHSIHVAPVAVFVAPAALLLIGTLSALRGRRYCNAICPVGTFLGLLSRFSRYKIRLKDDCIGCGLCERTCKGECIDGKGHAVDASRCVACFNCLGSCRRGSLVYAPPLAPVPAPAPTSEPALAERNAMRRRLLRWSLASFFVPALAASVKLARGASPASPPSSLPSGTSRVGYTMTLPILPPGAGDRRHFQSKCTACHLCVAKCPADIIRPSTTELGLSGFLQPVMKFDDGFCNYDCTICAEVCPTHALGNMKTREQKHRLQIGRVVFLEKNCVVVTQDTNCGACAEHCPTGAVAMVPYGPPGSPLTIPKIDPDLCVGCGACEHICPVLPYRAIYVDGVPIQGRAKPAFDPDAKQEEVQLDDFGF